MFPCSRFTSSQLRRHGVPYSLRSEYGDAVHGLANLQLLQGLVNIEKTTMWPWEWLASGPFPSTVARELYVVQNDLDLLPESISFTTAPGSGP